MFYIVTSLVEREKEGKKEGVKIRKQDRGGWVGSRFTTYIHTVHADHFGLQYQLVAPLGEID